MADNLQIGAHESIAGGLNKAIERIESVGGNCLQIFTKNSRFWAAKPLAPDAVEAFKAAWAASEVQDVVVHDSYLINLCSDREEIVEKSISALTDELVRTHQLGIPYLVMHPGSHVGQGEEQGIEMVARHLNRIFTDTPECRGVQLLLETTAGQGTNLGYRFEHLAEIMEKVTEQERVGVCFDTCHVFCAGYDISVEKLYEETLDEFDRIIGLSRLKVLHLNDSKHVCGSRKDRHDQIGKGLIGEAGFALLMNDKRLAHIPKILETDKSDDLHEDRDNIELLLSMMK